MLHTGQNEDKKEQLCLSNGHVHAQHVKASEVESCTMFHGPIHDFAPKKMKRIIKYLLGHRKEEKHCTHRSWYHAEQLWIQSIHISKLPGRFHTQTIYELHKSGEYI